MLVVCNLNNRMTAKKPENPLLTRTKDQEGRKWRIVSILDTEVVQRDQLAQSNEDINAEG